MTSRNDDLARARRRVDVNSDDLGEPGFPRVSSANPTGNGTVAPLLAGSPGPNSLSKSTLYQNDDPRVRQKGVAQKS